MIALISWMAISTSQCGCGKGGGCRVSPPRGAHPAATSAGGPALLDRVERVVRRLAADPRDHLPPERSGADLSGHAVGTVEPEVVCGVGDLGDVPHRLVRLKAQVIGLVWADVAT